MTWIPIEQERPSLDQVVILWDERLGLSFFGCRVYCEDAEGWLWCHTFNPYINRRGQWDGIDHEFDDIKPTHWHPLPPPPTRCQHNRP